METPKQSVEPYRYFWLHTNMPNEVTGKDNTSHWGNKKINGVWIDGDHYTGVLRDYCIGVNNDILVIVEPLIQVESDDGKIKWHRINEKKQSQAIIHFNDCTILGEVGKCRARFKSGDELFFLSSDPSDAIIFDTLIGTIDLNDI